MSNYAVWNNRLRHEWLSKPGNKQYISKRTRQRCGLEDALERKSGESADASSDSKAS